MARKAGGMRCASCRRRFWRVKTKVYRVMLTSRGYNFTRVFEGIRAKNAREAEVKAKAIWHRQLRPVVQEVQQAGG